MNPSDPSPSSMQGWRDAERETVEDVLRALLECEYHQHSATDEHLAGLVDVPREKILPALALAQSAGLVATTVRDDSAAPEWMLLPAGREIALLIMRAHRLVETRLARESGLQPEDWHARAHAEEHRLSAEEVARLADQLDNPRFDPHGDPIPSAEGRWPEITGSTLLAWTPAVPGVIAHIEDEPAPLYARLAREGIYAGMHFSLRAIHPSACHLTIEAREFHLPLELAAMIRVRAADPTDPPIPPSACRLSDLQIGESADALRLLPGCIGAERSRLLDLGFVPGSRIEFSLQSPFHGPAAYQVRGTLIALRREQADQVLVARTPQS